MVHSKTKTFLCRSGSLTKNLIFFFLNSSLLFWLICTTSHVSCKLCRAVTVNLYLYVFGLNTYPELVTARGQMEPDLSGGGVNPLLPPGGEAGNTGSGPVSMEHHLTAATPSVSYRTVFVCLLV